MDTNLSTLKRLAVCLGCCECTEDVPAMSNAEALEFICENLHISGASVTAIELVVEPNGKIVFGSWKDAAGTHEITIKRRK